MQVQLFISVPLANILLWTFTEAFIVLMAFHATRLLARFLLARRLSHGHKVPLIPSPSLVDVLPYNSDLAPLSRRHKLALTFLRFVAVAISVYVGAALDGTVAPSEGSFAATEATTIATSRNVHLTQNDGAHMPAMAKLSCLRIKDNDHVLLYRGYVDGEQILCEDGRGTFSDHPLAHARIRADYNTPDEGEDMSELNINHVKHEKGLTVGKRAIRFVRRMSGDEDKEESVLLVLIEKGPKNCTFGIRRSAGSGFEDEVDLKLTVTCDMMVLDFARMLDYKPNFLPPRMSFLHQTLNALVVSQRVGQAPTPKSDFVQATLTLPGVIVAVVSAAVITLTSIIVWFALRNARVKNDLTCIRGLAEMWGEEKFGTKSTQDKIFVALAEEGGDAYLGSVDGESGKKLESDLVEMERGEKLWEFSTASTSFDEPQDMDESLHG